MLVNPSIGREKEGLTSSMAGQSAEMKALVSVKDPHVQGIRWLPIEEDTAILFWSLYACTRYPYLHILHIPAYTTIHIAHTHVPTQGKTKNGVCVETF